MKDLGDTGSRTKHMEATRPNNSTPRSLHTAGPWHVNRAGGWTIHAGYRVPIATVATGVIEGAYKTEAIEANARLIAAAPELLEALRLVLDCDYDDERKVKDVAVIAAAIAKAEGAPSVQGGNEKS